MGRIVVGVDGSDHSADALEWAIREAELRGDEVDVIHTWQYPAPAITFEGMIAPAVDVDFTAEAQEVVDRVVKEALGGAEPTVEIRTSVPRGPAAQVLIEASEGADLLVVASRGHGGFSGLMLGSVSMQCAHHAHCPVVIVRA